MTNTTTLSSLREELLLHEAPRGADGAPCWTLEDPGQGRFFQIGWTEFEMMRHWRLGTAHAVADAVNRAAPLQVSMDEVAAFEQFLQHHCLVRRRGADARAHYRNLALARRGGSWLWRVLHHYLFFRIPLVHPDAFLARTLPWVRRTVLTRIFAWLTVAAGLLGLFLVTRQWDVFLRTFLHFFTWEGAAVAALTLVAVKVLHELGHAYAARHFQCRVASMGLAFMVLWPVLYTDSSGAWRLRVRRQRLAIGAAGILTELSLAAWATLVWSFLPDGLLRSMAFMLATTTWLLTLAINLNPLMRFDGYFLLADVLNVPNLQQRAFAVARWKLREWLFAWGDEAPEIFAPWRARAVLVYAYCTWIYRFFLFSGIALLVYHMAFKLLGILLALLEISVFIARPIFVEVRIWFARMPEGLTTNRSRRRTCMTLCVAAFMLALAGIPWQTSVRAPALLRAAEQSQLQAPVGARVVRIDVRVGQAVKAGDALFLLDAPDLVHEIATLDRHIALLDWQGRFHAMRQDSAAHVPVVQRELLAARERRHVLARQQASLRIDAAFDGVIVDLAQPLIEGEWVASGDWLGTLVSPSARRVEAFINAADLHRVRIDAESRFIPDDPGAASSLWRVLDIAATATRRLSAAPELVSAYGGPIAALPAAAGSGSPDALGDARTAQWMPQQAVYRAMLTQHIAPGSPGNGNLSVQRGTALIDASAESWLLHAWRRVMAILVRESGF